MRMKRTSSNRRGARLGQHFLTGTWAGEKLADAVGVRAGETIVEIGPGKGALTRELLKRGPVLAVEKDAALVEGLRETFSGEISSERLRLVAADVRDFEPSSVGLEAGAYVVAANIPYYITGEILRQFLSAREQPRAMALLIQKEVAERIMARDGKESILSISVKAFGEPRIVAKVSRGNFSPPPAVDSSIILISDIGRSRFASSEAEQNFFRTVRAGFASKRKFVASNLSAVFEKNSVTEAMARCGVLPNERAERLSLKEWLSLAEQLR